MTEKPRKVEAILYPSDSNTSPTYILIDGDYYASNYIESSATAKERIRALYLTKSFSYNGDTTKISLSDGREFFHPRIITDNRVQVFDSRSGSFMSMKEFDAFIEDIPLEGTYEEFGE